MIPRMVLDPAAHPPETRRAVTTVLEALSRHQHAPITIHLGDAPPITLDVLALLDLITTIGVGLEHDQHPERRTRVGAVLDALNLALARELDERDKRDEFIRMAGALTITEAVEHLQRIRTGVPQ